MDDAQWAFMRSQILSLSISAAVVRSRPLPVYATDISDESRRRFQAAIREKLVSFEFRYREIPNEQVHVANVQEFAAEISAEHSLALVNGVFRIGTAQKALNLYLKYLWCLARIKEPPHCPVDARVLAHIKGFSNVHWTQMSSIEEYKRCIAAIRRAAAAAGRSIACWELHLWNATVT